MASRWRVNPSALFVPLVAIAAWQLLKSSGLLDYEYLPAPGEVLSALLALVQTGEIAGDVSHTLGVALLAAGITLIFGGAIGLAIGVVPTVRRYLLASIDLLRTIPAVALVPVALLTFGPTVHAELMLAVYAGMWPIVLNTAGGVAAVHPRQYDVARILHFSPATTVRKIVIPAVIPAWLVGARVAAVVGLLVAIVAEMIMYRQGLGGGLVESLNALAPARMWAYALVCGVVGFLLNAGLRRAVRVALAGSSANPGVAVVAQPSPTLPAAAPHGLLPLVVVLVVWQLAGTDDSLSFPPPDEWLKAVARLHGDGLLFPAIVHTLTTYALGLVLATVIGSAVGVAIGASRRIDRALTPSIDFVAAIPGAALVPFAVLLLGPYLLSGVAVVALIVSWPILLNAAMAMRSVPAVRLEMSRTVGLSQAQRSCKVILPSLVPGIMLGVRIASSLALIIALLVDILGAGAGIGRLLVESQQRFDASAAWGLLLMVGTFGYLTSVVLAWLERRLSVHDVTASGNGVADYSSPPVEPLRRFHRGR
jgi:sulfonate transport system permease protein